MHVLQGICNLVDEKLDRAWTRIDQGIRSCLDRGRRRQKGEETHKRLLLIVELMNDVEMARMENRLKTGANAPLEEDRIC